MKIETSVLETLDPQRYYDWLGSNPADRIAQMEAQWLPIPDVYEDMDQWMIKAPDSDLIAFWDRMKIYGEEATYQWLKQRTAEATP